MSEVLFRMVLKRPAVAQSEEAASIRLAQDSPLQAALGQALHSEKPREALKAAARQYAAGPDFLGAAERLPLRDPLRAFAAALAELETKERVTNGELVKAVEDAFGSKPAELTNADAFKVSMTRLKDSITAIKYLPEEHTRPIEELANQLRDLELVSKAREARGFPGSGRALRRYRRRSLMLPAKAELRSALSTVEREKEKQKERDTAEAARRREAEGRLDLYRRLKAGIEELTSLGGEQIQTTPQKPSAGFLVPAALRPLQVFAQAMAQHQQVTQLNLLKEQLAAAKGSEGKASSGGVADAELAKGALARRLVGLQPGAPAFRPAQQDELAFRLKPSAEGLLSAATVALLRDRGLSLSLNPLDRVVEALRAELLTLSGQLDALLGRPQQRSFKRVGGTLVMITTPRASVWNDIVVGGSFALPQYLGPLEMKVPETHGSVAPAGIADLLVVKQQLVRYEAADVAHIENVLKGERKEREHTRRRETEELTFRETEITTSEERELESTNRFEMSRETSETIKEDASLKAGLTVSGKYGPTVEFSVSAEGSLARSKEEATKTAARFSQDVTERSAHKVTERVLERASLRVTNEVVEKNAHALDNVGGAGHVSGVYQWVNKVYQAQMFNYGLRTLYDFMVPEPAAFLIAALQEAHANATELVKPAAFALRPDQLTESNYHSWVQTYGATDVTAPPEIYKTKSLDFKAGGGDDETDYNHSGQIQLEEGYKAVHGYVGKVSTIWEDNFVVDVVLGSRTHRFEGSDWRWSTALDGELDSLPFALQTWKVSGVAVAVEVKCQRTDRALLKWKHETHAKLTQAYKARLAEYEEKLANLEMQAGVAIRGRNPALNADLMNDELKKNCVSVLTEQHFDLFDAIETGANGLPQLDLVENAAEGPYVRFFEQAFEWEHMTWISYPYFWGRKSQWEERVAYEDSDPLFNQFLKAGYCRVVVPVRPGFEGAIDHFMTFGETWNGGPLPPVSSPLYLPIADEIAERLDRPGDEIPQGDPWLVRIPTTLVHLRADDRLPAWRQNDDGEWVEEAAGG